MRRFRSLTKSSRFRELVSKRTTTLVTQAIAGWRSLGRPHPHSPRRSPAPLSRWPFRQEPVRPGCQESQPQGSWLLVAIAIAWLALTSVLGYSFYNQPQLAIGTEAPETILAPRHLSVEDERATEAKRRSASRQQVPVLQLDEEATQEVERELERWLGEIARWREEAGELPVVASERLSLPAQQYLRDCTAIEWRELLAAMRDGRRAALPSLPDRGQMVLVQWRQVQADSDESETAALLEAISQLRQNYARARAGLVNAEIADLNLSEKQVLLALDRPTWEAVRANVRRTSRQMLRQGIAPGVPQAVLAGAIRGWAREELPVEVEPAAVRLLLAVLRPNLVPDRERSRQLAEQAAQAVEPEMVAAVEGQPIVVAGETISRHEFLLLDGFGLSRRRINWRGLFACSGSVAAAIAMFVGVAWGLKLRWRRRDRVLLLLTSLSTPALAIAGIPQPNLAAVGLLTGSFYHPALAGIQVVLLGSLGLLYPLDAASMALGSSSLAAIAGGLLAAAIAGRLRSREELALLGLAIGLLQGGICLLGELVRTSMLDVAISTTWAELLPLVGWCALAGLGWSVVALGISPYLERLFDVVTPIRLVELSNPNRPLLQRLALETPGTFQHTLFVASLAEAAARELGANVELVRAGTLYHDIGKMHDPLGFIENQLGCTNKHDRINDPRQSAEIIKKHVSEGLVMARRYGLPQAVQDFIPEHQGTLLISYFYFQAQQAGKLPVSEAEFRYDGPIPQSRETGIVMLADGCEAALRSLQDATLEKALSMVNKIIRARWQDEQLVDSGLTRDDLSAIARVFVEVWSQSNHKRIAYPKAALEPRRPSVGCGQ